MPDPRPRKPRFRRIFPPPPIRLTARDLQILNLVSTHRFLRSDHLVALVNGSSQHLTRRLGRLYHSGLLERPAHQRRLEGEDPHFSYCLSEHGRKELILHGKRVFPGVPRMRRHSSGSHLGHDLRVADIVVSLQVSAENRGIGFHHHHDWTAFSTNSDDARLHALKWKVRLKSHSRQPTTWVVPDAAFSIECGENREAFLLLEVDRGTMPVARSDTFQSSFVKKVEAYRETRTGGTLWKRWQVPGFRVLVVTESEDRMRSLQAATARCFRNGTSTMFLFMVAPTLLTAASPLDYTWQDCTGKDVTLIPHSPTVCAPCQSPPPLASW